MWQADMDRQNGMAFVSAAVCARGVRAHKKRDGWHGLPDTHGLTRGGCAQSRVTRATSRRLVVMGGVEVDRKEPVALAAAAALIRDVKFSRRATAVIAAPPGSGGKPTKKRRTRRGGKRAQRSKQASAQRAPAEGVKDEQPRANSYVSAGAPGVGEGSGLDSAVRATPSVSAAQRLVSSASMMYRRPDGSSAVKNEPGQLVRLLEFLRGLGLSIEDCGRLVKRRPELLRLSIPRTTEPYLEYLRREPLSMNQDQVRLTIRHAPQIFSKRLRDFRPRMEFLRNQLMVEPAELAAGMSKSPHVLWMDLVTARSALEWLEAFMSPEEAVQVARANLSVLLSGPEAMQKKVEWLEEQVGGLSKDELRAIVIAFPLLFMYRAEQSMQRRIDFLRKNLRLPLACVSTIIKSAPQTLELGVASDLAVTAKLLREESGIVHSDNEFTSILQAAPKVFVTDISQRITCLRETCGLDQDEIRAVVLAFPPTLLLSVDRSLIPKWNVLTKTLGMSKDALQEIPAFFSVSLERVLLPRFGFLTSKNLPTPSLAVLISGSDEEFCRNVAHAELAEFTAFCDEGSWLLMYGAIL
ncbi:Transcription termination factor MTERF9, chloroplastic [Porphyridium purpureum]|uniref:Transcription termination factor MTERF9, chloroplastic n=1 Tax=Porphyridium purpureum TaxID=35688 RepID=A0A5J4Z5U6_PORPP|nr:Transcription termination factor MTERF9, chloroplastic [Porphyridium purpureum]|eukprot:POR9619..scf295_1